MNLYKKSHSISLQGVIQDFEVDGGNKKSNQKMLCWWVNTFVFLITQMATTSAYILVVKREVSYS